jgi:anti-repressor protein
MKNPSGGRPLTEYALSIDAAKELSMVEGNEKGKQARSFFPKGRIAGFFYL